MFKLWLLSIPIFTRGNADQKGQAAPLSTALVTLTNSDSPSILFQYSWPVPLWHYSPAVGMFQCPRLQFIFHQMSPSKGRPSFWGGTLSPWLILRKCSSFISHSKISVQCVLFGGRWQISVLVNLGSCWRCGLTFIPCSRGTLFGCKNFKNLNLAGTLISPGGKCFPFY